MKYYLQDNIHQIVKIFQSLDDPINYSVITTTSTY
jgi:hypothetical protein